MKKIVKVLLLVQLLILTGCNVYSESINDILNRKIEYAFTLPAQKPSYNHNYYSYYIEPSVGRITSYETSNVFKYLDNKFILNLNVSGIISSAYYPNQLFFDLRLSDLTQLANHSGTYTDYEGANHPYDIGIYQIQDGALTLFQSDTLDFYAVSGNYEATDLAFIMMKIARSVRVNEQLVVGSFSTQQLISNKRETIQLFQNLAPESGVIDQLLIDTEEVMNQQTGIYTTGDEIPEEAKHTPYPTFDSDESDEDLEEDTKD